MRTPTKLTPKVFVFLLLTMLLAGVTGLAQDDDKKKADQKKQDKAAKMEENASRKQAKLERRYQKIRAFSSDLYNSDPDFKDIVDRKYRETRQKHTRLAYDVNLRPSNVKLVRRDGEKLQLDYTLYDNPLAQDFVNRVGQSLVPHTSKKLYAFKIIQNPVPGAEALSTGTIYITTG